MRVALGRGRLRGPLPGRTAVGPPLWCGTFVHALADNLECDQPNLELNNFVCLFPTQLAAFAEFFDTPKVLLADEILGNSSPMQIWGGGG